MNEVILQISQMSTLNKSTKIEFIILYYSVLCLCYEPNLKNKQND